MRISTKSCPKSSDKKFVRINLFAAGKNLHMELAELLRDEQNKADLYQGAMPLPCPLWTNDFPAESGLPKFWEADHEMKDELGRGGFGNVYHFERKKQGSEQVITIVCALVSSQLSHLFTGAHCCQTIQSFTGVNQGEGSLHSGPPQHCQASRTVHAKNNLHERPCL